MKKEASFVSVATAITLILAAVSGGMWMGALASDVETLEEAQLIVKEDHDRLIKVETEVEQVKDDVEEIKDDVKEILTAVNALNQRDN